MEAVQGVVDFSSWYNITWMLYALIITNALVVEILVNPNAPKAAKYNALAWVATEIGLFLRIGWWQLGIMTSDSDHKFAAWAIEYDWVLIVPFPGVVVVGSHYILRRLNNPWWYVLGLGTIPAGLIAAFVFPGLT